MLTLIITCSRYDTNNLISWNTNNLDSNYNSWSNGLSASSVDNRNDLPSQGSVRIDDGFDNTLGNGQAFGKNGINNNLDDRLDDTHVLGARSSGQTVQVSPHVFTNSPTAPLGFDTPTSWSPSPISTGFGGNGFANDGFLSADNGFRNIDNGFSAVDNGGFSVGSALSNNGFTNDDSFTNIDVSNVDFNIVNSGFDPLFDSSIPSHLAGQTHK